MSNTKTVMSQASNTLVKPLEVEDVFSTYLYEGTSSAQTITNGIDLDGEGGMVWIKNRDTTDFHHLCDTERGSGKILFSNSTNGQVTNNNTISGFSSSGFSLGSDTAVSTNNEDYASWTFRKAPKFFDVVTYTGTGVAQNISHSLGSVPGMVVVKNTTTGGASSNWTVWHNGLSDNSKFLRLNTTDAEATASNQFNGTAPTSTVFSVGTSSNTNANGDTFVAYLFAHNDGDGGFNGGDIIKCGSFTDSSSGWSVDLGFEPQFLLAKRADGTGNWEIVDTMRGFTADRSYTRLYPNLSNAEQTVTKVGVNSTGFFSTTAMETNGATIIYMAIRRGTKVPESATEVFAPNFYGTSGYVGYLGAPADMHMLGYRNGGSQNAIVSSRLVQGNKALVTSSTAAEITSNSSWDNMSGVTPAGTTLSTLISWTWKRAPGFLDCVTYTGDGVAGRTVSHNLGVAPEMMWVKCRENSNKWFVYHKDLTSASYQLEMDSGPQSTLGNPWDGTHPTTDVFTVNGDYNTNHTGLGHIAYLFASLPGISKVGSYTGNGTSQTINCGFTSGARFILVKRTDSAGDWYIWDTERGIVAGNDPYLELNTSDAEVTSTDWVDPDNSGFIVNGTTINASSASYIFYAIA